MIEPSVEFISLDLEQAMLFGNVEATKETEMGRKELLFDNENTRHEKPFNLRLFDQIAVCELLAEPQFFDEATTMSTEGAMLLSKHEFYAPTLALISFLQQLTI